QQELSQRSSSTPWDQSMSIPNACTSVNRMRVDLLSREYPPEVYGGAGVHVAELVRALRKHDTDVRVRAFGRPREDPGVTSYLVPAELAEANPALATLGVDLQMGRDVRGAE